MKGVSVVVPTYNEEESVAGMYHELREALEPSGLPYELIFVDDGSTDESVKRLLDIAGTDESLKIIEFRRNFGQTAAMAAGLEHSRYD